VANIHNDDESSNTATSSEMGEIACSNSSVAPTQIGDVAAAEAIRGGHKR